MDNDYTPHDAGNHTKQVGDKFYDKMADEELVAYLNARQVQKGRLTEEDIY